jgi:hypothetical protein
MSQNSTLQTQLHRLVVPAGIFNPARTYSLVIGDKGLYVIFTGKAMSNVPVPVGPAGTLAAGILDKIAEKRAVEITAVEDRLRSAPAEQVLKERKHSQYLPKSSIKSVEVKSGPYPRIVVQAEKTLTFHCWQNDQELREFVAQLG